MNEENKKIWESPEMVDEFASRNFTLNAEQTVIKLLKRKLKNMSMLDVGVGAGRTTQYFAPLVKYYTGMDYSEEMVYETARRFPIYLFQVLDVRNLNFPDNVFDFVLFSWNGIDYIDLDGREKAFEEIRLALKDNGYFFFSTHNVKFLKDVLFAYSDMAVVNDGVHKGKLQTYYSNPLVQIDRLTKYGFKNIRVFSHKTGKEITRKVGRLPLKDDYCLHYLCQKTGGN